MNKKGQFSIIAALLVAVVLIAAVMTTYSAIRYNPLQDSPQVLSAIDEINLALKQILGFTVGYYGSVLKVTGNTSYARDLAARYLGSGLSNIGDMRPEWGTSFNITKLELSTNWFTNTSYSQGAAEIKYNLTGLGISNITYETSSRLDVSISNPNSTNYAYIQISKDENEPLINLGQNNFKFYRYIYSNSSWDFATPTDITSYADGTYSIGIPSGVSWDAFTIQVEDSRGLIVTASSFSRYSSAVAWNGNYSTIPDESIVVEMLQNGTIRWLGQNLNLTSAMKPIPPIPVKGIHVNQTINGVNQEVPFQVEDWASEYRIPLGLTSNSTVFNNRQMIVFLMNSKVTNFTIWWDGHDDALQTSFAYTNRYFTGDDQNNNRLTNGRINLQIGSFSVGSTVVSTGTSSTANFMRINGEDSVYGAGAAYVIHHGVVRDIVQQEAEWGGGISELLYVDSFNTTNTWSVSGSSPYLGDNNNYIYTNTNNRMAGWFGFQNLSKSSFAGFKIEFECSCSGDDYFEFQITDGVFTSAWYEIRGLPGWYGWKSYDLTGIINSVEQLNDLKVNIRYRQSGGSASTINIRKCRLDVTTCPNLYANMVITLPANATYYTYQLRLMFINSAQSRVITELCPISFTVSPNSPTAMTENGTSGGFPIVTNGTGTFYNYTAGSWTAHHWSQLIAGSRGAGIMFTDGANQQLYAFDSIAGSAVGALDVDPYFKTIELLPVARNSASFTYALDMTWHGAVATFDYTTPVYKLQGGTPTGLWILVEYPPTVTVTAET